MDTYQNLLKILYSVDDSTEFYPEDMIDALVYFINGSNNEEEEFFSPIVHSLYELDGLYSLESHEILISLADAERLPGPADRYTWPLDKDSMLSLSKLKNGTLVPYEIEFKADTALHHRYLIYCASKCSEVTFSWIETLHDKPMQPSYYVSLLHDYISERDRKIINNRGKMPVQAKVYWVKQDCISLPKIAWLDLELCPMRYLYGYIMSPYPVYYSDYHQSFIISGLIRYYRFTDPYNSESIISRIKKKMFSNVRDKEFEECKKLAGSSKKESVTDVFCKNRMDTDDPGHRLYVAFPRPLLKHLSHYNWTPPEKYCLKKGRLIKDKKRLACTFCPHIDYCYSEDIHFPVDKGGDSVDYFGDWEDESESTSDKTNMIRE